MRTLACTFVLFGALACAPTLRIKGPLQPFAPAGITAQPAGEGRRFALLVGIDHFDDERFQALRYAGADARDLAANLGELDFVQLLTSPEQTNKRALLAALDELAIRARDPRDTVILYLSTHGSLGQAPGGELQRFLVASDTRLDRLAETGIGVDDALARVEAMGSRRKVVVLATCHGGRGKSVLADGLSQALARNKGPVTALQQVSEAVVVLTASAFGEAAQESAELGHDIYTYFLLQALLRGDRDGDGAVTASEAHDFARERTYDYTRGAQRPTAESSILGRDPIVLSGKAVRTGMPVLFSYAPSAEGIVVAIDGREKGTLPGGVALEPGPHALTLTARGASEPLYEGRLEMSLGEEANLVDLIPPALRFDLGLDAGGLLYLEPDVRAQFLPPAARAGVHASLAHWPVAPLLLHARASFGLAAGNSQGLDAELDSSVKSAHLELGAGAELLHFGDGFTLAASGLVGESFASRSLEADTFRDQESLRGPTAAAELSLSWALASHLRLAARSDLGLLWARLGEGEGLHPYGALTLGLDWVWPE